jgi:hypothetical protein
VRLHKLRNESKLCFLFAHNVKIMETLLNLRKAQTIISYFDVEIKNFYMYFFELEMQANIRCFIFNFLISDQKRT